MALQRHSVISLILWLIFIAFVAASPGASAALCDVDADGDVDYRDILFILKANDGRRSTGSNDPRDGDRNGRISANDVLVCGKRCTRRHCAIITNNRPIAVNDSASTVVNRRVAINVVANDRDPGGRIAVATVQIAANPLHGRVLNHRNGVVTYIPATGYAGRDSFQYRVKDNRGALSNAARVSITIKGKGSNLPPIANAGADINAVTGQPVTLDGSASSDPERARLSFSWRFQSKPATSTLTNANINNRLTAAPNFTPDVDGVYELALTVSDGVNTNVDTVRVTAATANVPPNVDAGANQNALVNTTVNLTGTANDQDNGPGALTFTWTFVAPLPAGSTLSDANISNANTLTPSFTPDVVGAYTLRLSANDGAATSTDDVVITAANNTAPNASAGDDFAVPLGSVANLNGSASNDPDNRPSPLTYQWSFVSVPTQPPPGSALTNGNITGATTATPSFTPDILGLYDLRLDVSDGPGAGASTDFDQVLVKANVAPVANNDSYTTARNTTLNQAAPGVRANDTDANLDALTPIIVTPPNPADTQAFTLNADGSFSFTPTTNFTGQVTFTYQVDDGSRAGTPPVPIANALSNVATVTIDVRPPNNAPTFTAGPNQTVNEDAGAQTVNPWATAIDDGDPAANQTLTFNITGNTNPSLFSAAPAVSPAGVLTYTPAANANGSATVTVTLQDNGGTANGGVDTSAPQTFTITVNALNDAPSFTKGADQTVLEDAGAQTVASWATAISAGPADESGQTLTFNVTNNNNTLFSAQPTISAAGVLTYTPAANANGTATVSVTISDNGSNTAPNVNQSAAQTFTITVTAVNDAPIFTPAPGSNVVTVDEDTGVQNIAWASGVSAGPANEAGQTFLFSVSNTNTGLFSVQPAISAIGILTFTPAANANGSATITVTLSDNGGTANGGINVTGVQVFTITVNPVNDPPVAQTKTASAQANMGVSINAALLTGVTDADTGINGCSPTFSIASITANSGGTVSNINLGVGTFDFEPTPGFSGTAVVNYTVSDNGCPGTATSATAAINIAVSGPVIWFVDPLAGTNGTGTLASPFNSLASANTAKGTMTSHRIFVYSGATASGTGVSLTGDTTQAAAQWLVGQGATGASFDAVMGITPPTGTLARPTIGGTRPTIQGTLTLNGNNVKAQGFNLSTGTSTGIQDAASAVSGVSVSEVTATTSTGTAVNLSSFGGTVNLTSVSSNGATNGILLNTTTGSFTVTGTGTTDGSGGTIQNTTNRGASFISASNITLKNMNFTNAGNTDLDANNSGLSTGDNLATNAAIHLQSVTTATLDNLNISGGAEQGINGNAVSNFTLSNSSIVDIGNEADEDGIHFFNMSGTSAITNSTINSTVATPNTTGGDDHLNLQTTVGTLNLTVTGGSATNANKGSGYLFGIRGTSNATIAFNNANSSNNFSGGIVADAFDNSTMRLTVANSTSSSNNDQLSVSAGDNSRVLLSASSNTLSSPSAADFVVVSLLGSALDNGFIFDATLSNNTITVGNERTADGILVFNAGGGAMNVGINNNTIAYRGTQRAIILQSGQDGAGSINATVTGNAIDMQLDGTNDASNGIVTNGAITSPTGDGASICADIGGSGGLGNIFTHSLGGSLAGGDIRVRQRLNGTARLPGYTGSATDTAAVISYLNGRNTVVSAPTATVNVTGFAGGAACTQPALP